jgi:porin
MAPEIRTRAPHAQDGKKARRLAAFLIALLAGPALTEAFADEQGARDVTPSITYDSIIAANLSGGEKRGSVYVGSLSLEAIFDGERLAGWRGATMFLDVVAIHGGQPSALVGDAQGVNNLAAPPQAGLYEAWLEYNSSNARFSLLAGLYDLNSEFYRLNAASLFLNSSFGIGPEFALTGVAGPSIYPSTSAGVRIEFKPTASIVLRTAILDGAPVDPPDGPPFATAHGDGALIAGELALLSRPGPLRQPEALPRRFLLGRNAALRPYQDKVAVGAWHYTTSFDDLSDTDASGLPVRRRGSSGAYLLLDKRLYGRPGAQGKQISGFLEAGVGDARVNRFGSYVGFGIAALGLVPGRPKDEFGLGAAIARNGSHFRRAQDLLGAPTDAAETAIEATYSYEATDWLAIRPNLQYVIDPNTDPRISNATVFQIQVELSK